MIRRIAVVFLALLTACPLLAHADAQRAEAERLFVQAQEHLARGEHDQAVELFERSFLLSREPLLVYDIAQAYRLKGDCASALDHYRRYLRLTERDIAESAVEQTRQLAIDRTTELDRKCGQPAESRLQQNAVPQPAAAKTVAPPEAGSTQEQRGRVFAIPLGLAIVGGGAVTGGIYYLTVDGREQCTGGETPPCVFRRDTSRLGWVFVAGGAALLASAVIVAIWEIRVTPTVAVAVGPTSLRIGRRF
jgi:tetratricopeptide (TPR) repeat protein